MDHRGFSADPQRCRRLRRVADGRQRRAVGTSACEAYYRALPWYLRLGSYPVFGSRSGPRPASGENLNPVLMGFLTCRVIASAKPPSGGAAGVTLCQKPSEVDDIFVIPSKDQ